MTAIRHVRTSTIAIGLCAALFGAACGGEDSSAEGDPVTTPSPEVTSTEPSTTVGASSRSSRRSPRKTPPMRDAVAQAIREPEHVLGQPAHVGNLLVEERQLLFVGLNGMLRHLPSGHSKSTEASTADENCCARHPRDQPKRPVM